MKNISLLIILIASLIMASCHQPEKKTELEDQYAVSKKLEADSLNIYAMERSKDSVENIGIKGYNLKLISKGAGVDRLELEYHSQAQLLDKIRKEGKEKMSTESSINSDLDLEISTSRGGQIQVSDYDNSIGSAVDIRCAAHFCHSGIYIRQFGFEFSMLC